MNLSMTKAIGSVIRGFVYWLLTAGPVGVVGGTILRHHTFDRLGRVTVPRSTKPETVSAIVFGIYEYPERVLIERWLPPDLDCVELGCSIGIISRVILKKIHADRKLTAVEASKDLLELSKKNLSAAGFSDRFIPLHGAVHYQGDFVAFSNHEDHIRGTVNRDALPGGTPTPCMTLSNVLRRATSGPYSLVMDIEGSEFDLLANDLDSLSVCQTIIAELHGSEASINAFKATLAANDFELAEVKHSVFAFVRCPSSRRIPWASGPK